MVDPSVSELMLSITPRYPNTENQETQTSFSIVTDGSIHGNNTAVVTQCVRTTEKRLNGVQEGVEALYFLLLLL